ncbi:MAG: hypothetical protein C4338_06430 [Rhodanobacteraceae bacterium]
MRIRTMTLAMIAALGLAGCGDSTPIPAAPSSAPAPAATSRSPNAAALAAAFAPLPAGEIDKASRADPDCNLDVVDGKPAGSVPLARGSSPVFSGWAADGASKSVPPTITLVLKGAQDFAVQAATGAPPREDVAAITKVPAFRASGYAIKADLSAVPAGQYSIVILEQAGGKRISCTPGKRVTIQ